MEKQPDDFELLKSGDFQKCFFFFLGDKFNAKPEQKMSRKDMPSRKDSVSVFGKISASWLTNMLGLAGGVARQAACFGYASCVYMIRLYEYVN